MAVGLDQFTNARAVYQVDAAGNPSPATGTSTNPTVTQSQQNTYVLASNATIPAASGSSPVTGVRGAVYVWDAQWAGSGTLALQALGADGLSWREVATLAGPGTFSGEVRIGANATLRLFNKNAGGGASFTSVYSSLS
jgi:hypothetical protein